MQRRISASSRLHNRTASLRFLWSIGIFSFVDLKKSLSVMVLGIVTRVRIAYWAPHRWDHVVLGAVAVVDESEKGKNVSCLVACDG